MNNFNNGRDINVNGDFIINDNSHNINKPLNQCTNEELLNERDHRNNLLDNEIKAKKKKYKKTSIFISIFGVLFVSYAFKNAQPEFFAFFISVAGLGIPILIYFENTKRQTEFEKRQILVLNEITYLLKEREF